MLIFGKKKKLIKISWRCTYMQIDVSKTLCNIFYFVITKYHIASNEVDAINFKYIYEDI